MFDESRSNGSRDDRLNGSSDDRFSESIGGRFNGRSAGRAGGPSSSALPGFHRQSLTDRRVRLAALMGLGEDEIGALTRRRGLASEDADRMIENALGVMSLPLGLCTNLRVNGRDFLVPMVIEEPSVVAAASHAAKLLRAGGGLAAVVAEPHMVGQVQILDVPDPVLAEEAVREARDELLGLANCGHPRLRAAGGGAIDLELRLLAPLDTDDPVGPMLIVHLVVDVRDAMGANAINSMCERIGPRLEALTGGRVRLRILSNLADRRTVTVSGKVPVAALERPGLSGLDLARGIEEASVFAERDPYRAATHNKGIMNGVDAVLLAFGQDWRAVEAGAHAFAARGGRYTALSRWRVSGGYLTGRLELPMAVGLIGGAVDAHPTVRVAKRLSRVRNAAELASVTAAVGLAQNLGALRALAGEGIQTGHMRLHARKVAGQVGARGQELEAVAREIADRGSVNIGAARSALDRIRAEASR